MSEENKNNEELEESGIKDEQTEPADAAKTEAADAGETIAADEANDTVAIGEAEADENEAIGEAEATEPTLESDDADKENEKRKLVAVIAAVAVVILAAVMFFVISKGTGKTSGNGYNAKYIDTNGMTAGDLANAQCMEYEEYLEYMHLPSGLPKDTNANATQMLVPIGHFAKLQGVDFAELKKESGWDDSITEETPYGEALDSTALKNVIGEEQLDYFKQAYGLDDSVNGDTLFGEIRKIVDEYNRNQYLDRKKQEEEAEKEAENAEATEETAVETEKAAE